MSVSLAMSLLVGAAVAYAGAFVLLLGDVVLGRRWATASRVSGWIGLILHGAAIVVRWVAVGHGPIITRYENLSSYAFATAVLALVTMTRRRSLKPLGLFLDKWMLRFRKHGRFGAANERAKAR